MTPEEHNLLKAMTNREIVSKYFPIFLDKKITQEQFDWLIRQGKVEKTEEVLEIVQESFPEAELV